MGDDAFESVISLPRGEGSVAPGLCSWRRPVPSHRAKLPPWCGGRLSRPVAILCPLPPTPGLRGRAGDGSGAVASTLPAPAKSGGFELVDRAEAFAAAPGSGPCNEVLIP